MDFTQNGFIVCYHPSSFLCSIPLLYRSGNTTSRIHPGDDLDAVYIKTLSAQSTLRIWHELRVTSTQLRQRNAD